MLISSTKRTAQPKRPRTHSLPGENTKKSSSLADTALDRVQSASDAVEKSPLLARSLTAGAAVATASGAQPAGPAAVTRGSSCESTDEAVPPALISLDSLSDNQPARRLSGDTFDGLQSVFR